MELFLHILSTAGYVALIVLAVAAALIALILFLPVVYRIRLKKKDKFLAKGRVSWLFGAVLLSFSYDEAGACWSFRVFGIPLMGSNKRGRAKVEPKAEAYAPAKKQPTIKPGERIDGAEPVIKEGKNGVNIPKGDTSQKEISGGRGPSILEKIRFTFQSICDKLKKAGELKKVFDKALPVIKKLLKVILPKKISGYIDFGLDDPANTGMLVAVISMLCIPIPEKLKVTPYFTEQKLECDVRMTGRIFIILLIINAVRLFKIPEVRKLLGGVLRKGGKKHKNKK